VTTEATPGEGPPGDQPGGGADRPEPSEKTAISGNGADTTQKPEESFEVSDTRFEPITPSGWKSKLATRQEWTRVFLAFAFVVLLGVVIVWSFERTSNWSDTAELLDRLLPALTGLIGSAVGFYFGTRT
jgi:hypothetical protein